MVFERIVTLNQDHQIIEEQQSQVIQKEITKIKQKQKLIYWDEVPVGPKNKDAQEGNSQINTKPQVKAPEKSQVLERKPSSVSGVDKSKSGKSQISQMDTQNS